MEIENKTKKMKEQEKEDKSSLIKNPENNNEIEITENKNEFNVKLYLKDKRLVYHRLEGMEPGDDLSQDISNDIIVKNINTRKLNIGDTFVFKNTGAYSMTEGISLFLSRDLPKVVIITKDNEMKLVRDVQKTSVLNFPNYR